MKSILYGIKYMKKNLTHIIFIVDRSGSMTSIAKDMIGGYNSFIQQQKQTPGECFVSFYQFDDIYETVFERVKLQDVKDLDAQTYSPRNSTALFDALGKTIDEYGKYLASIQEDERPERVLVVTITDGQNNASREFAIAQVREKIKLQTETYGWDFVFLGSNIDAWDAGDTLGIARGATLQFANCAGSVGAAFSSLSSKASSYRVSVAKASYAFDAGDLKKQDEFLDENLKVKNKQQQQTTT